MPRPIGGWGFCLCEGGPVDDGRSEPGRLVVITGLPGSGPSDEELATYDPPG